MAGRTAIVTGASRGIGRELAIRLARQGVAVVVCARTVEPHRRMPGTIGETVAAIEAEGGRAIAVRADLADADSLTGLVDQALEAFGRIDFLVNNGAETKSVNTQISDYPTKTWLAEFAVNVHAPFLLTKLVVPHMRDIGGGVIVNVTSEGATHDPRGAQRAATALGSMLGYSASKAALDRMVNGLAPELAAHGIAIVGYSPPPTLTEYMQMLIDRGLYTAEGTVPMSVTADEIIAILADDAPLVLSGFVLVSALNAQSTDRMDRTYTHSFVPVELARRTQAAASDS